jgi:glycosyltransferase involved in cell wall biosynthesis
LKISVCIPTFNQADFIELAVNSVLNQTHKIDEIIISNDSSTDNTKDVLDQLALSFPQISVFHQPKNLGIKSNNNFALKKCTGDFIIKLDSDDFLLPTYTEKLLSELVKYPKAGSAHASVQEIDENNNKTKLRILTRKSIFIDGDQALKLSVHGYQVAANIIMFRRSALEVVDFINATKNFAEDFYLSASLSNAGYGNVYINEVLSCYRVWNDEGKIRQKRKLDEIIGLIDVYEKVIVPGFQKRNWSLNKIHKARASKACKQADCLSWDVFTIAQKKELKVALYKLSSNFKVKCCVFLYGHNLNFILNAKNRILNLFKYNAKLLIFKLNKKHLL